MLNNILLIITDLIATIINIYMLKINLLSNNEKIKSLIPLNIFGLKITSELLIYNSIIIIKI